MAKQDHASGLFASPLKALLGDEYTLNAKEEAAMFVLYARDGQKTDDANLTFRARRCYGLRHKYQFLFRIAAWFLLLVHFFERPIWTFNETSDWRNLEDFPAYGVCFLPNTAAVFINLFCLVILASGVSMEFVYEKSTNRKYFLWVLTAAVVIKSIDALTAFVSLCLSIKPPFSLSPIEGVFVLLIEKRYFSNILYLIRTIPMFVTLVLVLASVVCTYTALGFLIFAPNSSEASDYFNSYGNAVWNMLMVLNGSDWPPPMIPAYTENRLFFFYFMVYLVLVNWGLLNLILGFVNTFFRLEQTATAERFQAIKVVNLKRAFSVLDRDRHGYLTYAEVEVLLQEMYSRFDIMAKPPDYNERLELVRDLDEDLDGRVTSADFLHLEEKCFGTALEILRSKTHFDRYFSSSMGSSSLSKQNSLSRQNSQSNLTTANDSSTQLREVESDNAASNPYGKMTVVEILLLPAPTTCEDLIHRLARTVDSIFYDVFMDSLFFFLGVLYLAGVGSPLGMLTTLFVCASVESVSKVVVKGLFRIRKSYRNSFDSIITLLLLLCLIGQAAKNYRTSHQTFAFGVRAIILLRLIMFPRNAVVAKRFSAHRRQYRKAFEHALLGAGDFLFLLLVLLTMMYIFASLGQNIFGGAIRKTGTNAELITGTYYGQSGYWPLNFNDIPSGMATMFILLHVNNMHVTTSGFVAVTSKWAELFFAVWYAFGVLLLLNVLTAFVLNEFFQYISKKADEADSDRKSINEHHAEAEQATAVSGGKLPVISEDEVVVATYHTPPQPRDPGADDTERNLIGIASGGGGPHNARSPPGSGAYRASHTGDHSLDSELTERASKVAGFSKSIFANNAERDRLTDLIRSSIAEIGAGAAGTGRNDVSLSAVLEAPLPTDEWRPSLSFSRQPKTPTNSSRHKVLSGSVTHSSSQGVDADGLAKALTEAMRSPLQPDVQLDFGIDPPSLSRTSLNVETPPGRASSDGMVESRSYAFGLFTIETKVHSTMLDWVRGNIEMEPHEAAAVLVQYARDSSSFSPFSSKRALYCYRMRQNLSILLQAASWVLMLLKIFERPLWTYTTDGWNYTAVFPRSGVELLEPKTALAIKLPMLLVLFCGLLLEFGYKENGAIRFTKYTPMALSRNILMLYCVIQVVMLLYVAATGEAVQLVIATSLGSVSYVFWFNRAAMQKLRIVVQVIPKLSLILVVFAVLVLVFAAFGPFIFNIDKIHRDDDFNQSQFATFADSVWSVFVAITSSSYPGQVMPGYRDYRLFFFYFFAFICLGSYGVLNLILVVVLVEYNKASQAQSDSSTAKRKILLLRAFQIMERTGRGWLEPDQVRPLINELYAHYSDFRKAGVPSEAKKDVLLKILDMDGDGRISFEDFLYLIDVTRVRMQKETRHIFIQLLFPAWTDSDCYRSFVAMAKHKYFDVFVDSSLTMLIVIRLAVANNVYYSTSETRQLTFVILTLFLVEMLSKLAAVGAKVYWRKLCTRVDGLLTLLLLIFVLAESAPGLTKRALNGLDLMIRVVEMTRVIFLPRNLRLVFPDSGFQLLAIIIKKIIRSLKSLAILFICLGYVFVNIGVFCFGGLISKAETGPNYNSILTSQYGIAGFWSINFNDMLSGFVTMFSCLHVSDFDVITSGFVAVTSPWARLYFTCWYVLGVLLMLNIVKSFFLSEFLTTVVTSTVKIGGGDSDEFASQVGRDLDSEVRGSYAHRGVDPTAALSMAAGVESVSRTPTRESEMDQVKRYSMNPLVRMAEAEDTLSLSSRSYLSERQRVERSVTQYSIVTDAFKSDEESAAPSPLLSSCGMTGPWLRFCCDFAALRDRMDEAARAHDVQLVNGGRLVTKKYIATTEFVKDLNPDELDLLHQRLQSLAEESERRTSVSFASTLTEVGRLDQ